jgi:hypothetical protein
MRRSAGVTISAVIVFIGCAFTLPCAGLMVLGAVAVGQDARQPEFVQYAAMAVCVVLVLMEAWGIATGVGLIHLREWARISMLVFGGLLALFMGLPAIIFLFVPLPTPANVPDPEQAARVMSMIRFGLVGFYGALAVLGAFWIYFFARAATRIQFSGRLAATATSLSGNQFQEPPMRRLGRPVSITIIAVVLLVGQASIPVMLLVWRSFIPGGEVPILFFGRMIGGRLTLMYFLVFGVVQVVAAVGLLKLKPWARTTAIALQVFSLVNGLVSFGLPSGRAQFAEMMAKMNSEMGIQVPDGPQPFSPMVSAYTGLISTVLITGVILWFLIQEKDAFYRPKASPNSSA